MSDKRLIRAGMVFVGLAVLLGFAAVAWAQEGDIDPTQVGSQFIDAISGKQWGLAIGAGLMLVVWIIRTFIWRSVSSKVLPWLAVAIGAVGAFAGAMLAAPSQWLAAIMAGIQTGLAAAGTWGILPQALKDKAKPG